MSSEVVYKKKTRVQALDPESKHWLLATITDVQLESAKVTWNGYSKEHDCWLNKKDIRMPVKIRPMISRNLILKKNFPNRKHPKDLQYEDVIYDMKRNQKFIVDTNNQYEAKVCRQILMLIITTIFLMLNSNIFLYYY